MLPVPPHFEPGARRRGLAGALRGACRRRRPAWAREHTGSAPAAARRAAGSRCSLVDVQNTFCLPEFELFVAASGAARRRQPPPLRVRLPEPRRDHADRRRRSTRTRRSQIFHALWLVDADGGHPDAVHARLGRRRRARRLAVQPGRRPRRSASIRRTDSGTCSTTSRALERGGKYALTIWPYHAMLGGIGHALVSAVEEAVFFHSGRAAKPAALRGRRATMPRTEHYSALGPEVTRGPGGETVGGGTRG